MRRRALVRGSAIVVGTALVWHASNFLFNSIAARALGPAGYGELAAVMAILYVLSPVFVSVHTVASRLSTTLWVAGERERLQALTRYYGLRLLFLGALAAAAFALFSGLAARVLHIDSAAPLVAAAGAIALSVVTHLQRGVMQGASAFGRYSASSLLEAGTKILVAVALLAWLWPTVEAGLVAVVAGAAVAAVASVFLLRFLPRARGPAEPIAHPYAYSLTTLLSLVLLALLLSVDVLAAKRYLPGDDAGLYAAVSLCGKIVFFATSAFSVVLFPLFSARQDEGRDSRRHLAVALAAVAAVSGVLVAVYFLAPALVIRPLYGGGFEDAGGYIGWIGVAYACYAFVYLTAMYLLSQQQARGAAVLAVAVLAQLAALYTFHSSIWSIIGVQLGVFAATAAVLAVLARGATVAGVAAAASATEAG